MFSFETGNTKNSKEFMVTMCVAIVCLFLSIVFPVGNSIEGLTRSLFFFLIIPIFFIKFILKKSISDFGINLKNRKTGVLWGILMLALSFVVVYVFIEYTGFIQKYEISPLISSDFKFFLVSMLIFSNLLLFFQEFFFRGFMLSLLKKKIGAWSVAFQSLVFFLAALIIHGGLTKSFWQIIPAIIISITGGVTAYKSQSMVYSWIFGLAFLILFSAYAISVVK